MFQDYSDTTLLFLSLAHMVKTFTPTLVDVWELTGEDAELLNGYHVDQCMGRDESAVNSLFEHKLGVTYNFIPCNFNPGEPVRDLHENLDIFCGDPRLIRPVNNIKPLSDKEIVETAKNIKLDDWEFELIVTLLLRYPSFGGVLETTRNPFSIEIITPGVEFFLRNKYLVSHDKQFVWTDKAAKIMYMSHNWDDQKRNVKDHENETRNRLAKEFVSNLSQHRLKHLKKMIRRGRVLEFYLDR